MIYIAILLAVLVCMSGWIIRGQQIIMATSQEILDAEAKLKADLATQTTLIKQLLTAFAGGTFTPAQAQGLLDDMTAEDADTTSNIAAIQAALPTGA